MWQRALLIVLVAAATGAAQPGANPITKAEVRARMERLGAQLEQVHLRVLKKEDVLRSYHERSRAGATPRDMALNAYMWGLLLQGNGQGSGNKEALREFKFAVQTFPAFPAAWLALAELAVLADDMKEAERCVHRALQIDPTYVDAILMLGQMEVRKGNHEEAIRIFKKSLGIEVTAGAFTGLAASYVELFRLSYDPEEKKELAQKAIGAAEAWITMEPENERAYLVKVQVLQDLGLLEKATEFLERAYAEAGLADEKRMLFLIRLRGLYTYTGNIKGVESVLERLLKHDLTGPQREQVEERLKTIREKGAAAPFIWMVEAQLDVVENEGISVDERRQALTRLIETLKSKMLLLDELRELHWEILKRLIKVLVDAPPELTVELMQFFRRDMPDPRLARILVHFIYPYGKTPELRAETVRALGACLGRGAVPALLYCLRDDAGDVGREVDKQLSALCEVRSPVGGGIEPLTPEELGRARKAWVRWAHTPAGGERIAAGFKALGEVVQPDPAHVEHIRSAPMVDHAANVLLDNDIAWPAWAAAYEFLVRYWGKDFRPVARRGKPVEESEREQVVKELDSFFSTPGDAAPAPVAPGVPGDESPKEQAAKGQ